LAKSNPLKTQEKYKNMVIQGRDNAMEDVYKDENLEPVCFDVLDRFQLKHQTLGPFESKE
jgi:hypothetical protein